MIRVYYSPYFIDEHSPLYQVDGYYFDDMKSKLKDNSSSTTLNKIYEKNGTIIDVANLNDSEHTVRFIIKFN